MDEINNSAIINCASFYHTYSLLRDRYYHPFYPTDADSIMEKLLTVTPYIVNGAIACELALKSAMSKNEAKKYKHNLFYLFYKSDFADEYRTRIIDAYMSNGFSKDDFDKTLNKASDLFVKWRYFYEAQGNITSPDHFKHLVDSICLTMIQLNELS